MPLFTTLPNALGHLNSLFGGDNWAKCSTVMYPVWLLVACFFMMDRLVVWTEVLRPLLLNKSVHTHLYFDSVTEEWKTLQRSPDQNTEINENKNRPFDVRGKKRRLTLSWSSVEKTISLSTKAGSRVVPLLHLTVVQNDSWRLLHWHHGRADVAATFQMQQHLISLLFPGPSVLPTCTWISDSSAC